MRDNKKSNIESIPIVHCKVFPGKSTTPEWTGQEEYSLLYKFWHEGWNNVMRKLDGSSLGAEQLLDRDVAISLWDKEGPAGLICATYYPNVFPWTEHPYFSMYSKAYLPALRERGVNHMWGGQWVFVADRLSVKRTGVSFAAVLIGLLLKYCDEASNGVPGSAMITMARSDVSAAKLVRSWGGEVVNQVELHNVPCEELYCPDLKHGHEDSLVNELTNKLWTAKIDYRGSNESNRRAA